MSNPPKTIIEVQGRAVAVLNQNSEGGSPLNIRSQTSHPHSQRAGVLLAPAASGLTVANAVFNFT